MKVALIHDHLAQDGGAEQVLKALCDIFPDAPIYTLLYDPKNIALHYPDKHIEASIIQKLPGGVSHYRWYLPLMPMAVEFFDLSDFDVVISDSSSFAKGVITRPDTLHISYCHTPTRYLWSDTHEYIKELPYNKYFKKFIALAMNYVRIWDRQAADRVDIYLTNSETAKKRISKYYRRDSQIIYPPVDVNRFRVSDISSDYFLAGCRLVPYKRLDIVIRAFMIINANSEKKYKLKIFGDGIDKQRLEMISKGDPNIEFTGRVSDHELIKLYSECRAFINPQIEDFGITVVEAMASGRPAIAYRRGGATETVLDGKTGIFFDKQTPEAIAEAVRRFETMDFDPQFIRAYALQFSTENFKNKIKEFVKEEYKKFLNNNS